jgi:histidinol-phosphate aminotransferase
VNAEPRPDVRAMARYVSPQIDVAARLATNESPWPLPEGFFADLARAVQDLPLNRYPDGQLVQLREELASTNGHALPGTWAANGSNEILTQLLQAYGGPGRRALVFEPTYMLHSRLSWLTNTAVERRSLPDDFVLTPAQVAEARELAPDVAFVCSPNNPTGNLQPLEIVRELVEALPTSLIVVDEAYAEFAPGNTALPLVAEHANVAVVRTFSKAFALAGARIGYVLADPDVVEMLQRVRLPYHVSALTQAAGIAALRHREEALDILGSIREQRDRIAKELGTIDGVTVFPSDANFVLFRPPGDAVALWQALLDRGVLIRDLTGVVPNALRVTAGTEGENDLFLTSLREVLGA